VQAYQRRISGPLLDRIDLHVEVPALPAADLDGPGGEPSAAVAARVAAARERQASRRLEPPAPTNAALTPAALRAVATPDVDGARLLRSAIERLGLSGRAHDRVLRVARTIADLHGRSAVGAGHVAEALQFRSLPATQ
jgi:magnesium chelatase family protein